MNGFLASIAIALSLISSLGKDPDALVRQRIDRIENGLIEFSSPKDLFQTGSVEGKSLKTLAERMVHYRTPGVSIAVIDNFALDWAKPYGILRAGQERPVALDSYFEAASTSKLVTAAIVLHCVEKGTLKLDEDINTYLKSWKLPENEFTHQRKVTLRLLLTHRAGLPATNFPVKDNAGEPTLVEILKGESPALNKPAVVELVPGTKWQYSNIGYIVIQQVLEDTMGKPFFRIAQETVFEPLGMKHSTFNYPLPRELQVNEAWPHDEEGTLREPRMVLNAQAHGGLMTTPSDLALFAIELMRAYDGGSHILLSKETARQMFAKAVDLDPAMMGGLQLGEGMGAFLYGAGDDLVFLHPGGNSPGMNCWLFGYPKTGRGAVIMTNGASGEILAMEIISAVVREFSSYSPSRASSPKGPFP